MTVPVATVAARVAAGLLDDILEWAVRIGTAALLLLLRPLASSKELQTWLDRGPLLTDGASWFGDGHWFVGIGYDQNGVYIRDSSGWDVRYLTWSRLYGEVGFSGWVVGVGP